MIHLFVQVWPLSGLIVSEPGYLDGVLREGAARVAPIANRTVRLVKERMGLYV